MFEPGDRARCINDRGWVDEAMRGLPGPAPGSTYSVLEVAIAPHPFERRAAEMLRLREFPRIGFDASGFARIGDAELERLRRAAAKPPIVARELAGALP